MRTIEVLLILLRLATCGLLIAALVRFRRLASYNGVVLRSVVWLLAAMLWWHAWVLVIVLNQRVGFLPGPAAWAFREFAGFAHLPLGLALGLTLYVTAARRR